MWKVEPFGVESFRSRIVWCTLVLVGVKCCGLEAGGFGCMAWLNEFDVAWLCVRWQGFDVLGWPGLS